MDSSGWLLKRDPTHPEGPGRWLHSPMKEAEYSIASESAWSNDASDKFRVPVRSIIRVGDELTVEESSIWLDARLQGVALEPAVTGATIVIRLRITGKVVRAVVLAAGRASIVPGIEEHR